MTGVAGFIGMHVAQELIKQRQYVLGIDSINDYYDVSLKKARLNTLSSSEYFTFVKLDVADSESVESLFAGNRINKVIHLAAQAGVRYSLEHPQAYIDANVKGFLSILETCRKFPVEHLVYASSSSVYGGNTNLPFSEDHNVDHPLSLYAATKKSNELMAHCYSHLFNIPTSGLRFFTVYGPWGRPDMALFMFTKAIIQGNPIRVFNQGEMTRDFTYIDDIVRGIVKVSEKPATPSLVYSPNDPNPSVSSAPYRVFNIGNSQPESLISYIVALEQKIGIRADKQFEGLQPGDVVATEADTSKLAAWTGYSPKTQISDGISAFVDWYRAFYKC